MFLCAYAQLGGYFKGALDEEGAKALKNVSQIGL